MVEETENNFRDLPQDEWEVSFCDGDSSDDSSSDNDYYSVTDNDSSSGVEIDSQ